MTYQDTLDRLSEDTQQRVLKVLAAYLAGDLADIEFEALVVAIILTAQDRGAAVADLSLSTQVTAGTGRAVASQGRRNPNTAQQVRQAVKTTMERAQSPEDLEMRLVRMADNEPRYVARDTYQRSLRASSRIEGWTRGLDSDPCELCVWWWRGGRVWPKDYPLQHHKGCNCTQVPVMTKYQPEVPHSRILSR
ncbi:hypothetical protein MTQ12_13600 [Brevibacterium sp. R8603A2]|uniref:hypothetical protein n=1 Tax=Brevibacterium sp. R8603A2 TaxID=2929779 RepID=UPI001FF86DAC|nr:hypothetical protein [Brevibacterium sp. R8603A2]MCK1804071.1 hypothetical protein [Brevibacterium sp. R8603A2]